MIEPSQARYRTAVAMQRLASALGVELDPSRDSCECLERLAAQAERLQAGAVSFEWVLSQLGGMSFPEAGYAYDYMRSLRPDGRDEIADERSPEDWKNHAE